MANNITISDSIKYIGVDDRDIDLFESQYVVPNGISYNSYLILDDKIAVMDTVDRRKGDEWLRNLETALDGRTPDYLVTLHMEADHASIIAEAMNRYPAMKIVGNAKTFAMTAQFFGSDYADRRVVVCEGDTLPLGTHTLQFVMAPMVHWPEVMVAYEQSEKVLFSADGFGKFGALDADEDWACEARRYYFGIVGKFGMQVQNLLKKAAALDIRIICPLHGPVLTENLEYYVNLYQTWSSYGVESEGIMIAYTSVYGHTKAAAELLAEKLTEKGCPKVVVADLAREDKAECVEDAFRYGKLVLATTTYNAEMFPFMREFIDELISHNYQKRTIALMENGSWAPMAAKAMRARLEGCKDITYTENTVQIRSALTEENMAQIEALADELMAK